MDGPTPHRVYQYRPLESHTTIRVLILQPADDFDGPLRAQLVHVQSEHLFLGDGSPSHYEAVSYCWGEPILSHVLHVDEESSLGITGNADTLLRHLRSSRKRRYLWIDALCLNQADTKEKQIQVQLMGRIYAQAAKVRVWLGTAEAHQKVPQLYNVLRWLATRLKNKKTTATIETEMYLENTCGLDWGHALSQFFARRYFQRRWILQEIALGHHITIHCGQWKLSWQWFIQGIKGLRSAIAAGLHKDPKVDVALDSILAIENCDNYKLLDLLWRFHQSQCSLPQDKIFALYGLARDAKEITEIDYSRHWSETFSRVAGAYFQEDRKSIWLHLAHFGPLYGTGSGSDNLSYPSWVPNWNITRGCATIRPDDNTALLSYNGFKYSSFSYDSALQAVEFDSYYAGRVENIRALCMQPTPGPKQTEELVWTENKILALSEVLLAFLLRPNGSPTEYFKQVMRVQKNQFHSDLRLWRETLLPILQEVGPWNQKHPTGLHTHLQAVVSLILDAIWNEYDILYIHGKRDAIGVGPRGTRSGDLLVVPPQGPTKVLTNSVYWPYKGHPLFGIMVRPSSGSFQSSITAPEHIQPNQKLRDCQYSGICCFSLWKQDCEEELDKIQVQLV